MNIDNENPFNDTICDLTYLNEMMGGKKHLVLEIMETFLIQIPGELKSMNEAIANTQFPIIKNLAHSMKSSVAIMGIRILRPILQEMENLGEGALDLKKIASLNRRLNSICRHAIDEVNRKKIYYA